MQGHTGVCSLQHVLLKVDLFDIRALRPQIMAAGITENDGRAWGKSVTWKLGDAFSGGFASPNLGFDARDNPELAVLFRCICPGLFACVG